MSSILELGFEIADELSLGRPSSLVGDGVIDDDAFKIIRHMTKTCRLLAGRYDWTFLRNEYVFSTDALEVQSNAIPTDFKRFIDETFWNRTTRRMVEGPLTPQEWQCYVSNIEGGTSDMFRQRGSDLLIYPAPPAGQTLAYEYIVDAIGTNDDGSEKKSKFTIDTDKTLFDDELIILGTIWRYKKGEGQDYSEEFNEYENRYADIIRADGGSKQIHMGGTINNTRTKAQFNDWAS